MAFTFQRDAVDPKYAMLAKFFMEMGNRNREDQATAAANAEARSRLDYAGQKDREKFDYEESQKTKLASEMAEAIRLMFPENRPDMPTDTTLLTQQLGDLSGMPGVQGAQGADVAGAEAWQAAMDAAMRPGGTYNGAEFQPNAAETPLPGQRGISLGDPASIPTQAGPGITGDIGETRKMSSEEMLPELMARLAKARVPAADMQRIHDMLIGRNDYNVAKGEGLGGEGDPSPSQTLSARSADADVGYVEAQTKNLNAAAEEKMTGGGVNPNAGFFVSLTDKNGQVIGFYNPKTDEFKENPVEGSRKTGLPSTELNRRGMLTTILGQLDNVTGIAEKNKDSIGGVFGWRGKMTALKNKIGGADPGTPMGLNVSDEESQMLRELSNIGDMILRARSGAQINEKEAERLKHLVPEIGSPDFWPRLASFRREIETLIGSTTEQGGINPKKALELNQGGRGTSDDFDAWLAERQ